MTADELLRAHDLRSTRARREIVAYLQTRGAAATSAELERACRADRVTTYRTLLAFEEAGILHRFRTESSRTDYFALCGGECTPGGHDHEHPHFRCLGCERAVCIRGAAPAPAVDLPRGYTLEATKLTYEGLCPACNATQPQ